MEEKSTANSCRLTSWRAVFWPFIWAVMQLRVKRPHIHGVCAMSSLICPPTADIARLPGCRLSCGTDLATGWVAISAYSNSIASNGMRRGCYLCRVSFFRFKMKPPKYTAEQVDEIIERIAILRMRWLAVVRKQLASPARDDEPEHRRS